MKTLVLVIMTYCLLLLAPFAHAIVGGEYIHQPNPIAKSTVGIVSYNTGESTGAFCSGSLIANHYVITAAHCLSKDRKNTKIVFSDNLWNPASISFQASQRIPNPLFNEADSLSWSWDIAVLRFEEDIPQGYASIRIQDQAIYHDIIGIPPGQFFAAGYGDQFYGENSKLLLKQALLDVSQFKLSRNEGDFFQKASGGTCDGDSGGPLFVQVNGEPLLVGLVSGSRGGAMLPETCGYMSRFTIITASVFAWIKSVIPQVMQVSR